MKKNRSIYTILVTLLMLVGCDEKNIVPVPTDGVGTFALSLTQGDVQSEVITRSVLDLDTDNFLISLSEADGTSLIEGKRLSALTEAECTLPAATGYQIKAESCTPEESITLNERWGMAHFVATTTFDIVSNQHTPVSLTCSMDNAGVQFVFEQSFLDKFPIHAVTTQDARSLVFNKDTHDKIAYYPIEEDGETVRLKLTGSAGGWSDRIEIIQEMPINRGKIYIVSITYNETMSSEVALKVSEVH